MDLAIAGMISGAGDAATKALQTAQTGMITNELQKTRDAMETRRLTLQHQFAVERDTTAYTRGRADLAEGREYTKAREREVYDTGRTRKATEAVEDLQNRKGMIHAKADVDREEFEAGKPLKREMAAEAIDSQTGLVDKQADLDRKKFDAGKDLRKETAVEEITNEVTKATMLAENKAWLKAQMILANAKESSASRAQAAKTMFEIEQAKDGAKIRDQYVSLVSDPNADPAKLQKARETWAAYAMKPGESEKIDATNAAAGMREAGNEIVRLQAMMKDQIPGTPEYAALSRRLSNAEAQHEAFTARVRELTGTKSAAVKEKLKIKDPFKSSALGNSEKEGNDITKEQLAKELQTQPPKRGMIHSQRGRPDARVK